MNQGVAICNKDLKMDKRQQPIRKVKENLNSIFFLTLSPVPIKLPEV